MTAILSTQDTVMKHVQHTMTDVTLPYYTGVFYMILDFQ